MNYQDITPEKRAKDLFDRFSVQDFNPNTGWHVLVVETVDQCLSIVDEFIGIYNWASSEMNYWRMVKSELLNLNTPAKDGNKEG